MKKAQNQQNRQMQSQSVVSAGNRRQRGTVGAAAKPRPSSAPVAAPSGLKISFKPAELNKTTEKNVAQQIRAVLGKTPSGTNNNNNNSKVSSSMKTPDGKCLD